MTAGRAARGTPSERDSAAAASAARLREVEAALAARTQELAESREQQGATSEVLRLISQSTSTQPVFESIASATLRLCGSRSANVMMLDGPLLHIAALAIDAQARDRPIRAKFPRPPGRDTAGGRAVIERRVVVIPDVLADTDYGVHDAALAAEFRSLLAVPLLQGGKPIGAITTGRPEPGPFPERQITLLQTFADQAVIAIENARLFRELAEKSRQLEVASAHKSAFLANMSHELRTPLNAIIGFARIVLRRTHGAIEERQSQNLEKILASGQHLLALINSILDLAKIEAGRVELHPADFRVETVLEDCLRTVEPLIDASAVTLVRAFDGTLPTMHADEEKVRQIVINLLSNAAKFTAKGRIELRARSADDRVEIAVADTGIGIPPEKLELVFEEFEQVDATSTRAHGGTGLGLAIARRLARLMGGDIGVVSEPGAGSTFTLTLPVGRGT